MRIKTKKGVAVLTCGPLAVMAVATIASTAMTAYSSYQSGQSQKEAADANAANARAQAHVELQNGALAAADSKERARRVAAQQSEIASAAGFRTDSGTPLALLTETAGLGEYDALVTRNNAQRRAYGLSAQGDIYKMQGDAAAQAGMLNAGGTFLGGAASAAGSYYTISSARAKK